MERQTSFRALLACRPAWSVLLLCALLTSLAHGLATEHVLTKDMARFTRESELIESEILGRWREYEVLLRGGQGLFAASKSVERGEWKAFVGGYAIEQRYAGMVDMAFIACVPAAQLAQFLLITRGDYAPDYIIRPSGEREHYYPIKYVEPLENNDAAIGNDLGVQPVPAAVLESARDTELPTLTPPLQLVQDRDGAASVVLYLAVYRNGQPHRQVAERRQAIEGWVGAPVRIRTFMAAILQRLPTGMRIQVFDGRQPGTDALLHDSHPETAGTAATSKPLFERTAPLEFGGRTWTVCSSAGQPFMADSDKSTPLLVILCGLVMTGLLLSLLLRRQLEDDRREAQAASRAKSEFLANMSHEIRTPMTSILGYADLLLDPEQSAADRAASVQTIRRNGHHLLTVINDILDLSKIEAGKVVIEQIRCSTIDLVQEIGSLMRPRASERNLQFEVSFATPVPETILTDPTRLRQILLNLIGNALKFTERGAVQLVVRYAPAGAGPAQLRFSVIDTGPGLTAEQRTRLFKPFSQADASTTRRFGGTGLGLMISVRLAKMLGGDIDVDSEPGRGSTFSVTIDPGALAGVQMVTGPGPVHPPDAAADADAPEPRFGGRILLAEDGPDNQRLISFLLRKAGGDVVVVHNGEVACSRAAEAAAAGRPFDLVLLDMQMPVLDGYAATARLRRDGYRGAIVALTANAMAGDRERCLAAGCDDYATKPIDRQQLLSIVSRHLGPD